MSENMLGRRQAAAVLGAFAVLCPSVFALNPSLEVNQYGHTAWTVRDGFFKSGINAICQDRGSYLLLGSELGLLRFDGVRPVSWPADEHAEPCASRRHESHAGFKDQCDKTGNRSP